MRVLVLGGGGFLGSHVTDRLVAGGHEVTAFDRFPAGTDSLLERCGPGVRALVGDNGDRDPWPKMSPEGRGTTLR
ncbi:MAG: NAD(P)-dependent oxidoreductase [Candidatus Hydrogenedentes bacterium]|nr:NAD(P)-dependent oxidoreductase [Candidatus Hydrogenedentota bacterium]